MMFFKSRRWHSHVKETAKPYPQGQNAGTQKNSVQVMGKQLLSFQASPCNAVTFSQFTTLSNSVPSTSGVHL